MTTKEAEKPAALLLAGELEYGCPFKESVERSAATELRRLHAENERLTAALAATPAAPQWRPIETAPNSGAEILLSDGERVTVGQWVGRYFAWGVSHDPTYWMPLPTAPGQGKESSNG